MQIDLSIVFSLNCGHKNVEAHVILLMKAIKHACSSHGMIVKPHNWSVNIHKETVVRVPLD